MLDQLSQDEFTLSEINLGCINQVVVLLMQTYQDVCLQQGLINVRYPSNLINLDLLFLERCDQVNHISPCTVQLVLLEVTHETNKRSSASWA